MLIGRRTCRPSWKDGLDQAQSSGEGYSNLQREGEPKRVLSWKKGDMYIVEANEYHDNRPVQDKTTRYLQVKMSGCFHGIGNVGQTIQLIDE